MKVVNLWEETIYFLLDYGMTWDDVLYVQMHDFQITKENFEAVAKDTFYDDFFGTQEIDPTLVLIGETWWAERREYDGLEWWTFVKKPKLFTKIENVKTLKDLS